MKIEILGMGCSKCNKLFEQTQKAVNEINKNIEIQKITNIKEIMKYQVMITPALVINGKVKLSGRVPSTDEIKKLIEEEKV
jgi:small redox-active disulfide protein 2